MSRSRWYLAAAVIGVALAALVAAGVGFVVTHRDSVATSASAADAEFARLRAALAAPHQAAAPIRTFHTVVFDTRGQDRMVRIAVPLWLARHYARHDGEFHWLGEITFLDDTEFDPQPIRLSLADVERRGAGVVADYRREGGGQFLSWVD